MRAETFYERSSLSPPKNRKELYISVIIPFFTLIHSHMKFRIKLSVSSETKLTFLKPLKEEAIKIWSISEMHFLGTQKSNYNLFRNHNSRNLHDPEDPNRIANKPNSFGYTPLYVACKNGNLRVTHNINE
jgi:hypothetical protein